MTPGSNYEYWCRNAPFLEPALVHGGVVAVGGRYTREAIRAYAQTDARVHTLVDWPAGVGKPTVRQIEAVAAAKDGAHAIEITANPPMLIQGEFDRLREDLLGVVVAVREVSRMIEVHVVIDTAYTTWPEEKVHALCTAVRESGGDGIVVWSSYPDTAAHLKNCLKLVTEYAKPMLVTAIVPIEDSAPFDEWFRLGTNRAGILWNP